MPSPLHHRTRNPLAHAPARSVATAFRWLGRSALLAFLATFAACGPQGSRNEGKPAAPEPGALLRVGSIVVYQSDLDQALKEKHADGRDAGTRRKVLEELGSRAQATQAALDARLELDPVVRAEVAQVLASRLKEKTLLPRLKELSAPIAAERLRELYKAGEDRFRSDEKRQVAVLWLDPGGDPERGKAYEQKLAAAREWLFKNGDLKDQPEQGFSVLSVDHSEHAASRYKGGVVGWMERGGGMDAWTKAVAEIAFSLKEPGEVSAVITRKEGVFLVRYMALKPAVLRPFESVSAELERAERQRLRAALEDEYDRNIKAKHPVEWLTP